MIELDEDALICDLAETYHIFDYRSLPVQLVATLSSGLRDDSRIMLRAAGSTVSMETIILASIADNLSLIRASFSKDAKKPPLFSEAIMGAKDKPVMGFKSASEFEAKLAQIRGE